MIDQFKFSRFLRIKIRVKIVVDFVLGRWSYRFLIGVILFWVIIA